MRNSLLTVAFGFVPTAIILCLCLSRIRSPQSTPTIPTHGDIDMALTAIESAPRDADVMLLGDSITQRWVYHKDAWNDVLPGHVVANLGVGGATVGNVLWMVDEIERTRFNPRFIVLMIGTNDVGPGPAAFYQSPRPSEETIIEGIEMVVSGLKGKFPNARIVLMGIMPRFGYSGSEKSRQEIEGINESLATIKGVTFIDLPIDVAFTRDGLHLTADGYVLWGLMLRKIIN